MVNIGIAILKLLIGVVVICGVGFVTVWVCSQMGIEIPGLLVKCAEIILGLLVLIALIRVVRSGGTDDPFKW